LTSTGLDLDALRRELQGLIRLQPSNLGVILELPVYYPTGEAATVVVASEPGRFIIHDAGMGAMSLSSHGLNLTRRLAQRLDETAAHYGCEFLGGRMIAYAEAQADIPIVAATVANASRSIADQILLAPTLPLVDFRAEAIDAIKEALGASRIRENEQFAGESGSRYSATAVILNDAESAPVGIVEPVKDHDSATKKFREFWDLSRNLALSAIQRIAMYDDRRHWQAADLSLLQNVANVVRLSDARQRMLEFARR